VETTAVTLDDEQSQALRQVTGKRTTKAAIGALIEQAANSRPNAETRHAVSRKGTRGDRVFTDPAKLKAHLRTLV
jgi:hypothetical protein